MSEPQVIYFQFKLSEVHLFAKGDETKYPEIQYSVLQSLKDRYAEFVKVVEFSLDDLAEGIDDELNAHSSDTCTIVDVACELDDESVVAVKGDTELAFKLAIFQLENTEMYIARNWDMDRVAYVGIERKWHSANNENTVFYNINLAYRPSQLKCQPENSLLFLGEIKRLISEEEPLLRVISESAGGNEDGYFHDPQGFDILYIVLSTSNKLLYLQNDTSPGVKKRALIDTLSYTEYVITTIVYGEAPQDMTAIDLKEGQVICKVLVSLKTKK